MGKLYFSLPLPSFFPFPPLVSLPFPIASHCTSLAPLLRSKAPQGDHKYRRPWGNDVSSRSGISREARTEIKFDVLYP